MAIVVSDKIKISAPKYTNLKLVLFTLFFLTNANMPIAQITNPYTRTGGANSLRFGNKYVINNI